MNKYFQEEIEFSFDWIMTLYRLQQYKKEKEKNKWLIKQTTITGKLFTTL